MWPLPPPLTTQKYYPGYATEYHDWHEFRILLIYRQSVVSVEMFKTDGDGVHRAHTRTEEFSSSRRCKRSKKLRNCTRLSFYDISVIIISIIFYYCFFFFFFLAKLPYSYYGRQRRPVGMSPGRPRIHDRTTHYHGRDPRTFPARFCPVTLVSRPRIAANNNRCWDVPRWYFLFFFFFLSISRLVDVFRIYLKFIY